MSHVTHFGKKEVVCVYYSTVQAHDITQENINLHLGLFDTKEQTGMAYDRFVVDKSTEEVSYTLNYPNGLPTSGTNKDGTDDTCTDLPTATIKEDPEAELILHKAKEVHVKSEPEADF